MRFIPPRDPPDLRDPIRRTVDGVAELYGTTKIGRQLEAARPYREAVVAAEQELVAAERNGASTERKIELCRRVLKAREEYDDMATYGRILQPNQRRALGRRS